MSDDRDNSQFPATVHVEHDGSVRQPINSFGPNDKQAQSVSVITGMALVLAVVLMLTPLHLALRVAVASHPGWVCPTIQCRVDGCVVDCPQHNEFEPIQSTRFP